MTAAFLRRSLPLSVLALVPAALAQNGIQWNSIEAPNTAVGGTILVVTATVTNTGSDTWGSNHNLVMKDGDGVPLEMANVEGTAPSQTVTRTFTRWLPDVTETMTFHFQALEHEVEWFGPTESRIVSVTPAPPYAGMQLAPTTFSAAAPPIISTTDLVTAPHYRLRAKVIDGSQHGWHMANLWNLKNYPVDSPALPGNYPICALYWVTYHGYQGDVATIGPERREAISVQHAVELPVESFHDSNPPYVRFFGPTGGSYRLFANFSDGQHVWETANVPDSPVVRLNALPPAGTYQVSYYWESYAGSSPVRSAVRTKTVTITSGPLPVLAAAAEVPWWTAYTEYENGDEYTAYGSNNHTFDVPVAGTLRFNTSGVSDLSGTYGGTSGPEVLTETPLTTVAVGTNSVTVTGTTSGGYYSIWGALTPTVPAPTITSAATAAGALGAPFTGYAAAVSVSGPVVYSASNLPPGLGINSTTGAVTGTPTVSGTYASWIAAANAAGSGGRWVTFVITSAPPRAFDGTEVTSRSFVANWSPVPGATGYRLDVADNAAFSNPILGDYPVTYIAGGQTINGIAHMVRSLQSYTYYYYRVRAVTSSGTTVNSNTIMVRTSPLAATAPGASLWIDMPVPTRIDGVVTAVTDGVLDEIIPMGGSHGLTYFIYDWMYTGGSVAFDTHLSPVNDWWSLRNVSLDSNGDNNPDSSSNDFTTWWNIGATIYPYRGETLLRLAAEFYPEPGYIYDICYSNNDVINTGSLGIVSGGGGISVDAPGLHSVYLFNPFTAADLDKGSLYLVKHTFAPSGVQVTLPVIGDVILRKGAGAAGAVSGAITIFGDLSIVATTSSATITRPSAGSGSITVSGGTKTETLSLGGGYVISGVVNGNITLTTPSGAAVTTGPGGTTLTIPGGVSATVSATGAVSLNVPIGAVAALKNAADQLGILLGLGTPNGPTATAKVIPQGSAPEGGTWEPADGVILANRPAGDYDVGVRQTNAPNSPVIWIRLTVQAPPPPKIAVDADRDGNITFSASDATSVSSPYRFWLNDDDDISYRSADWWSDLDPEHFPARSADSSNHIIESRRDCEDLTRMWINAAGLIDTVKDLASDLYLGLKWKNTGGTHPSIRLFRSADPNGGLGHIKNAPMGAQQASGLFGAVSEMRVCLADADAQPSGPTVGKPWTGITIVAPPSNVGGTRAADFVFRKDALLEVFGDRSTGYLLFEGVQEGKGELMLVVVRKKSNDTWEKVSEGGSLWLQLDNIRRMYVRAHATPTDPNFLLPWRVATPAPWPYEESTEVTESKALSVPDARLGYALGDSQEDVLANPFVPSVGEQAKCVVFVHGIDLTVDEQQGYAQSFFKRLWWEGYRGRFIAFRWSTPLSSDGFIGWGHEGTSIYNSGEYRAFKGGTSLRKFIGGLATPGNPFYLGSGSVISLAAHSQGNIAAGEALRQGAQVNSYVALEAAVSLSCYYSSHESLPAFPRFSIAESQHPTSASHGGASPRYNGYFTSLGSSAKISYHNADDFWLVSGTAFAGLLETNWIANNAKYKPDGARSAGDYRFSFDGGPYFETSATTRRGITDAHESMAFVCRSMTLALGAVAPPPMFDSQANLKTLYGFGIERPDHSGQFQRDIQFMYGNGGGVAWGESLYARLMRDLQVSP